VSPPSSGATLTESFSEEKRRSAEQKKETQAQFTRKKEELRTKILMSAEEAMIQSARIRGVLAPVVTPFKVDLSPDRQRFIAQIRFPYFLAVH
jgi:hypothetical protein